MPWMLYTRLGVVRCDTVPRNSHAVVDALKCRFLASSTMMQHYSAPGLWAATLHVRRSGGGSPIGLLKICRRKRPSAWWRWRLHKYD
eukprot:scaffold21986_cov30-Tisochrysis_lutea.AAC.4